jgi:hypothetical protein
MAPKIIGGASIPIVEVLEHILFENGFGIQQSRRLEEV